MHDYSSIKYYLQSLSDTVSCRLFIIMALLAVAVGVNLRMGVLRLPVDTGISSGSLLR